MAWVISLATFTVSNRDGVESDVVARSLFIRVVAFAAGRRHSVGGRAHYIPRCRRARPVAATRHDDHRHDAGADSKVVLAAFQAFREEGSEQRRESLRASGLVHADGTASEGARAERSPTLATGRFRITRRRRSRHVDGRRRARWERDVGVAVG